jgi:hypothetical protein
MMKENWANSFTHDTNGLSSVVYVPGCLRNPEEMLAKIECMFSYFSGTAIPSVRAWVNGGQRYTITDNLIALAKQSHRLGNRLQLGAESREYCVTLNGISAWSEEFFYHVQRHILQPLYEALGEMPAAGADFYAFFGNYGYTPFGIHDDTDHSLLWHLGPGIKTAYVWPRQRYVDLTGGVLSKPFNEKLLGSADRYVLGPGDLLFIPKGDFHLLHTPEFSATLGLTLFPEAPSQSYVDALQAIAGSRGSLALLRDKKFTLDDLASVKDMLIASNGGVIRSPYLINDISEDRAFFEDPLLKVAAIGGCPVLYARLLEQDVLIVRGRLLWSKQNTVFSKLADILNHHGPISIESIADKTIDLFDFDSMKELLFTIYQLRGISICHE